MRGELANYPFLVGSTFPTQLLSMVGLYFYVAAMTTPGFHLNKSYLKHLIIPGCGLLWYLVFLLRGEASTFQEGSSFYQEYYLRQTFKVLVAIPYLILARQKIIDFSKTAKDHLTDLSQLRLSWLRAILVVAYGFIAVDVLDILTGTQLFVWQFVPFIQFGAMMFLAFFSLKYSRVFAKEFELEAKEEEGSVQSLLSPDQLEKHKTRLLELLEKKSIYLNPDLRLSDLATALGLKPYRVSEVLNRGLGTSFYDLINTYRIKKAQELIGKPEGSHFNLLGISLESGFKSKSVFNDVFKRNTGLTPSEYRSKSQP
jgi:AraC-like DNA-binding protein